MTHIGVSEVADLGINEDWSLGADEFPLETEKPEELSWPVARAFVLASALAFLASVDFSATPDLWGGWHAITSNRGEHGELRAQALGDRLAALVQTIKAANPLIVSDELRGLAVRVASQPKTEMNEHEIDEWARGIARSVASAND